MHANAKHDYVTLIFWRRDRYPEEDWADVKRYLVRCGGVSKQTAQKYARSFQDTQPSALDVGPEEHLPEPREDEAEEVVLEVTDAEILHPGLDGDEDAARMKVPEMMTDEEVLLEMRNGLIQDARGSKWPKDRNAARKELRRLLESPDYKAISDTKVKPSSRQIASRVDALVFGTSPERIEEIYNERRIGQK